MEFLCWVASIEYLLFLYCYAAGFIDGSSADNPTSFCIFSFVELGPCRSVQSRIVNPHFRNRGFTSVCKFHFPVARAVRFVGGEALRGDILRGF